LTVRTSLGVVDWLDDPGEDDHEERWGSPETDLPSVPEVEIPTPSKTAADAGPELKRAFWGAVVLANVGVAGITIGPMLVFFRGNWTLGLALVGLGVLALVRTYTVYRSFVNRDGAGVDR
jgi:hypothetical protein